MEPITVAGKLEVLGTIGSYVLAAAAEAGLDKKKTYKLRLAVDEIATNSIVHGYDETGNTGDLRVSASLTPKTLTIILEDTAPYFDPRTLREKPDHIDKAIEDRPIGGLGVYLTLQGVDKFDYEYVPPYNRNIFIVSRD